jgi:hypothetical protein
VVALAVLLLALAWAAWSAAGLWWTTDDAFISFRYARNLVEGAGLVFNPGEQVEGYTNPLWTVWAAAGLRLGFSAENWANAWGLAAYLASIALLGLNGLALGRARPHAGWLLPLAAIGAALHQQWQAFAVSGLETAAFTFLLVAGYLAVVWQRDRPLLACAGGLLFALATLTRHDGLLPAAVAGLYLLAFSGRRWRSALLYGLCFAALWLPFTAWRISYYGDFFPNTYYAKSGYLAWYSQGLRYLQLYLEQYWALALGPLLLVAAVALRRGRPLAERLAALSGERRQLLLAGALAGSYTLYVARVGGDFMFARFLIPATPFLLILFESGWHALFPSRQALRYGLAAAALAGMVLTPVPVHGSEFRYGVANEREYYNAEKVAALDHSGEVLGRFFAGLPVRVAFYGDEARIVYKARFHWAVEGSAALNDPVVARLPLEQRGRVGHEKVPSAERLIEDLRAHFTFSKVPAGIIQLNRKIPRVYVQFDEEVWGQVLHWDPELMAALRERGARFGDFSRELDRYIARLDQLSPQEIAGQYEKIRRFYFEPVGDPAREAAFRERLGNP